VRDDDLRSYAEALELELELFDKQVHADRVYEDFMSGVRSGVNGTPTFFMNGLRHSIDEALSVVDEGLSDDEDELVGDAVLERDEFASPEEAAKSVRDNAPGATDHDDPHPADEED
jgi:hypothetical protein